MVNKTSQDGLSKNVYMTSALVFIYFCILKVFKKNLNVFIF
jgi:hypothetical protein